jgi:DmsE family decaheme c-type cytochrome
MRFKQAGKTVLVGLQAVALTFVFAVSAYSADKDLVLKGDAKCTQCHNETWSTPVLAIAKTKHGVTADSRTPTCTSCHGDSGNHIAKSGGEPPDRTFGRTSKTPAEERSGACLTCHQGDPNRAHWSGSTHQSRDVACSSCHQIHTGHDRVRDRLTQTEVCYTCHKEQRTQANHISRHPIKEGKVVCSDCHNPHGSTGPKLLVKNSVNQTCYTCHAEKRGPFLWEHAPVTDDCTNCHLPHGSVNTPMLKARVPWLCQECHSGDHGNQINSGANLQSGNVTTVNGAHPLGSAAARVQLAARACLNCHVLVHGSNHPAGPKFQR